MSTDTMKLDVKITAVTIGLVWGVLGMLLTGLGNLIWPGYGQALLYVMASVYPGYDGTPSVSQVIIGTLYGVLDGAVVGAVFAWLYNMCTTRFGSQ